MFIKKYSKENEIKNKIGRCRIKIIKSFNFLTINTYLHQRLNAPPALTDFDQMCDRFLTVSQCLILSKSKRVYVLKQLKEEGTHQMTSNLLLWS